MYFKICSESDKMANFDERLCLQWNDFRENVSSAFGDLREDREFTDVTLACEDGQQVEAHKGVLIASSPFFLNILKRNKHSHPLIYMRGVYLLKRKMPLSKYLSIAGITSDSHLIWWPYRRWFPPSRHFGLSVLITWDSYLELPIVVNLVGLRVKHVLT